MKLIRERRRGDGASCPSFTSFGAGRLVLTIIDSRCGMSRT